MGDQSLFPMQAQGRTHAGNLEQFQEVPITQIKLNLTLNLAQIQNMVEQESSTKNLKRIKEIRKIREIRKIGEIRKIRKIREN